MWNYCRVNFEPPQLPSDFTSQSSTLFPPNRARRELSGKKSSSSERRLTHELWSKNLPRDLSKIDLEVAYLATSTPGISTGRSGSGTTPTRSGSRPRRPGLAPDPQSARPLPDSPPRPPPSIDRPNTFEIPSRRLLLFFLSVRPPPGAGTRTYHQPGRWSGGFGVQALRRCLTGASAPPRLGASERRLRW